MITHETYCLASMIRDTFFPKPHPNCPRPSLLPRYLHEVQPDTEPGEQPNATNFATLRPLLLNPPHRHESKKPRPTPPLGYLAPHRLPLPLQPLRLLPSPSTTHTITMPKVFTQIKILVSGEGRNIYRFYRCHAHLRQGPLLPVAHFWSPRDTSHKCRLQDLIQPAYGTEGSDP